MIAHARPVPATDTDLQLTPDGRLRHLLTLQGLDRELLVSLLDEAETYLAPAGAQPVRSRLLAGRTVGNLFFEPSTRTRASFDLAGRRLGADVLNLDVNTSSRKKGESILDTIYTLEAMAVDVMVIRDAGAGIPAYIARHVKDFVSVLNAGEADVSHPTQGLLDLLTIRQHKPDFANTVVAIVGDVRHSRVARSAAQGLDTLGVGELRLVSPPAMAANDGEFGTARIVHDLKTGLADADVVMALRIQKERIRDEAGMPSIDEYRAAFGLDENRLRVAKPDAIVMHPGPMNRGIEIDGALADGKRSVITRQVTNGVAVRMAVLAHVARSTGRT
ncbi:MAG TPA: aspartate carbamoyltransferase catalytic subunit [Woeseiaceae bacterium]|nr:aspartate carbamoyltransferase catalytic subunit [Woeseiaceae bacterium]